MKLLLVTAQMPYIRGRDTGGLAVRHEAGMNYYELAEEPLSDLQRNGLAAAGIGFRRGIILSRVQLALLGRKPTPLAAAVVDSPVQPTAAPPPVAAEASPDAEFDSEAGYRKWDALPYKELQEIAARHEIPAFGVKRHDLITALLAQNAPLPA